MNWTDEATASVEDLFRELPEWRRNVIDARALMLFVNIKMLGLGHSSLPGSAPVLDRTQIAQFRQLALNLEPTFLHPLAGPPAPGKAEG